LLKYIFKIQLAGYSVILAHPERYDFIINDPNKIIPAPNAET
jgi:protein-tyrosine phosphatase